MDTSERDRAIQETRRIRMQEDFTPSYTRESAGNYDARLAEAAEYIAYHMGKISRNLERIAAQYPAPKK